MYVFEEVHEKGDRGERYRLNHYIRIKSFQLKLNSNSNSRVWLMRMGLLISLFKDKLRSLVDRGGRRGPADYMDKVRDLNCHKV